MALVAFVALADLEALAQREPRAALELEPHLALVQFELQYRQDPAFRLPVQRAAR